MSEIPYDHIQRLASHGDDPQMPGAVRLSAKVVSGWLEETATPAQDDTVLIAKSMYAELIKDSQELGALHAAGVDNWDGYEEAMDRLEDAEDDAEEDADE